ncbi:MAG: DUF2306 domain-containing protein [Candidatus Omnitrophota bacterium]
MHYSLIEMVHIITGVITFFVGPWQFIPWIRRHALNFHRLMGKTYILCVCVSAPTGLIISFKTDLALAAAGTALQSALWFVFTGLAYQRIRAKKITEHQRWMIRSYALVLAAPALRLFIIFLETCTRADYKMNFDFWYPLFVWLSFLPLAAVEIMIRTRPVQNSVNR